MRMQLGAETLSELMYNLGMRACQIRQYPCLRDLCSRPDADNVQVNPTRHNVGQRTCALSWPVCCMKRTHVDGLSLPMSGAQVTVASILPY